MWFRIPPMKCMNVSVSSPSSSTKTLLPSSSDQALVDVAGAADVVLGRLRHEARRDVVQEGDLLDAVLVDRVAVRGGDGVRVAGVDLVLAVPGLALGELDRDAGGVHATADRPEVGLVHRRGEDVVVEDVRDRRGEVLEVLLPGLRVALLVEVELELGGGVRREAHLPRPLVHGDQDLAGRGDHRAAVVVDDVGQHQRACGRATGSGAASTCPGRSRSPRSRPPSWPSRSRAAAPCPCRARAGSCSPRPRARPPRRGSTRSGSACRTAGPACP